MKRRLKLGIVFLVLAIPLICLFVFIKTTMNAGDIDQYCLNNTKIGAISYGGMRYYGKGESGKYAFWVAEDSLSGGQELFMFRLAQFGPFERSTIWDRLDFAHHVTSEEPVGSFVFTPRDPGNRKQATNWMVFYSSNPYRIHRYVFTVEENGHRFTMEGAESINMAFVNVLPGLGEREGILRIFVKAEFYDVDGKLIATIDGKDGNSQELKR